MIDLFCKFAVGEVAIVESEKHHVKSKKNKKKTV